MQVYSIGEVAKQLDIGIETIRFYERKGLIEEPPRKESGYRQYDENALKRLAFIRKAKTLGFTLMEIQDLLSLKYGEKGACEDIRRLSELKLMDIEERIAALKRMKRILTRLVDQCPGKGSINDCPILDMLSSSDMKHG